MGTSTTPSIATSSIRRRTRPPSRRPLAALHQRSRVGAEDCEQLVDRSRPRPVDLDALGVDETAGAGKGRAPIRAGGRTGRSGLSRSSVSRRSHGASRLKPFQRTKSLAPSRSTRASSIVAAGCSNQCHADETSAASNDESATGRLSAAPASEVPVGCAVRARRACRRRARRW